MPGTFDVSLQGHKLVVSNFSNKERPAAAIRDKQTAAVDRLESTDTGRARTTATRASRVFQCVCGLLAGGAFLATHWDSFALAVVLSLLVGMCIGVAGDNDNMQLRYLLIASSVLSAVATPAMLSSDRCSLIILLLLLVYDVFIYCSLSSKTVLSNIIVSCTFVSVCAWLLASYVMEWNAMQAAGNDGLTLAVLLALSSPNMF